MSSPGRVMSEHDQAIVHSSEDPNWRTPRDCVEALDREFHFGLDAAADTESSHCHRWFGPGGLEPNALAATEWVRYATRPDDPLRNAIFLNPPFSRTIANAYNTGRIKRDGAWVDHPKDPAMAQVYKIEHWALKCWEESRLGATIVGLFPFSPQTDWYRLYVYGHLWTEQGPYTWSGHCAREERRLSHRVSYLRANGDKAANAGNNTAVIVWRPPSGIVGPWVPHQFYWSYRSGG